MNLDELREATSLDKFRNAIAAAILIIAIFFIGMYSVNSNITIYSFDYELELNNTVQCDYKQLSWVLIDSDDAYIKGSGEVMLTNQTTYTVQDSGYSEYDALELRVTITYYKYSGGEYAIVAGTEHYSLHLIPVTDIEGL